jgi:dihydroorotate dehydrogenase subfamily 2
MKSLLLLKSWWIQAMMKFLYQHILKPVLFQFDPETVHDAFVSIGKMASNSSSFKKILNLMYGKPEGKEIQIDGLTFKGPVLLSAGFDYNGHLSEVLYFLGIAGEEVGSVTARPCPGNSTPRLTRLIKSQSIQVYKGLRNDGVDVIIQRMKQKKIPSGFVLGISIAKTNDEVSSSTEEGIQDYCYSLKRLVEEDVGDFYTINISCPNAFGGEDFASPDRLRLLLSELKKISHSRPMYIKMPINLPWDKFRPLLDIIKELQFNGVVIGNLNKNYDDLDDVTERPLDYRGGLSGRPCFKLSNELIQKTRQYIPENFTIMGCGGVLSQDDAMEKLRAGADLIQMISGMIFSGPQLVNEINYKYQSFKKADAGHVFPHEYPLSLEPQQDIVNQGSRHEF